MCLPINPLQALLQQLRDGHTLLLIGARTVVPPVGPTGATPPGAGNVAAEVEWDAAAEGAAAQVVTSLPALLTTPALQDGLTRSLTELTSMPSTATAAAPPPPIAIVEVRVAGASVRVARVHWACGRHVSRSSLGLGDLGDLLGDDDTQVADGGGGGDAIEWDNPGAALWACNFCCVECGAAETELAWAGSLSLALVDSEGGADGSGGAAPLQAAAEHQVWRTLLPFSPEQWLGLPPAAAAVQVAHAAVGRKCRVCIISSDSTGVEGSGRGPSLTATQLVVL
jgi:hypothetical protein